MSDKEIDVLNNEIVYLRRELAISKLDVQRYRHLVDYYRGLWRECYDGQRAADRDPPSERG